jgi:hypothetical protein
MIRYAELKSLSHTDEVRTVNDCHLYCIKYRNNKVLSRCDDLLDMDIESDNILIKKIECGRKKFKP